MNKYIVTFGQAHAHNVGSVTLDHNCVASFMAASEEEARDLAFENFGPKWCFLYPEEEFKGKMKHFPRGEIAL